jgi:hypothetical protein
MPRLKPWPISGAKAKAKAKATATATAIATADPPLYERCGYD